MRRVILSGTSHSGKSTLLEALAQKGYRTIPEVETQVRQGLVRELGSDAARQWIRENYFEYRRLVGDKVAEVESIINASSDEIVILDRSAVCYIGYCHLRKIRVPPVLEELANRMSDMDVAFLGALTSFDERKSEGRIMTKEEAQKLVGLIQLEYEKRGFRLIHVPEFYPDKDKNIQARIGYIKQAFSL